jgi:hypothetical protein
MLTFKINRCAVSNRRVDALVVVKTWMYPKIFFSDSARVSSRRGNRRVSGFLNTSLVSLMPNAFIPRSGICSQLVRTYVPENCLTLSILCVYSIDRGPEAVCHFSADKTGTVNILN